MKLWVEQYLELYPTQNVVLDAMLDGIIQRPTMEELDEEPTVEELNKVINCLSNGKPQGDGIPLEVIKRMREVWIEDLHKLLCLC